MSIDVLDNKKILITGSEGLLGKLTVGALKGDGHELILLDKIGENPVDLLKDEIDNYFSNIDTVIHFAANTRPWITDEEAKENIDITYNVLKACRKNQVNRIVYASSINVYDMNNLYGRDKITSETPIHPNTKVDWKAQKGGLHYPISKITCEVIVKSYCQAFNMSGLNLRFGCVTPDNIPYQNEPEDSAVWLSHEDFIEIIKRSIEFVGFESLTCVSNNSEKFVDLNPLRETLGYMPVSNSAKLEDTL